MNARTMWILVGLLALLGTSLATAQTGTGTATTRDTAGTAAEPEEPAPPPAPVLEPGISANTPPAWVAIQRGHRAFQARDFDTALAAYREAAMATPPLPIAHYFIGAAQHAKGQLDEALESFRTVSRLAGDTDAALKAKALMNIAWTLEAKQDLASAREAWLEYKTWCTTHASIAGFPQTADERVAAIDTIRQLDETYAAVRQRIAERAAAAAATPPPAE
jgi:tetratricopeptide (TPR) repeat protein